LAVVAACNSKAVYQIRVALEARCIWPLFAMVLDCSNYYATDCKASGHVRVYFIFAQSVRLAAKLE